MNLFLVYKNKFFWEVIQLLQTKQFTLKQNNEHWSGLS